MKPFQLGAMLYRKYLEQEEAKLKKHEFNNSIKPNISAVTMFHDPLLADKITKAAREVNLHVEDYKQTPNKVTDCIREPSGIDASIVMPLYAIPLNKPTEDKDVKENT